MINRRLVLGLPLVAFAPPARAATWQQRLVAGQPVEVVQQHDPLARGGHESRTILAGVRERGAACCYCNS